MGGYPNIGLLSHLGKMKRIKRIRRFGLVFSSSLGMLGVWGNPVFSQVTNPDNGFTSIFDGKTLSGWKVYGKVRDIEKNYWTVEKGTITCNTIGDKNHSGVWLFYEEELTDFELKVKFQAYRDSPGNSGLQVRSRLDKGGDIDGPQFDIHPPNPFRTGLLYDESDGYNRWIFPSMPSPALKKEQVVSSSVFYYSDDELSWNELHIICKGTNMKSFLNGTLVTDFDGEGILNDELHREQRVGMKGKIALQVHGKNELLIRFKDVQLKKTHEK